jgi:SagB-type dehydrogenase family enzyme
VTEQSRAQINSGVPVPASAYSTFTEAVAVQPNPDPAIGPGSTEFSTPQSLKVVNIGDLLSASTGETTCHSLVDVLARRRSVRSFGPLASSSLARLLDLVFALQWSASADDGGTRRFRPVPSAGARHPLAPLVLIENIDSLDAGLWRFDPDARKLYLITVAREALDRTWRAACDAGTFKTRPPAIVVLAAKFDATLARYPAGAALVWRDAGVALGTLHLTATHLGLASCILGTAGTLDGDVLEACGVIGNLVGDVGSLAVGGC